MILCFPEAVCTFKRGDGIGGSEKRIGDQVGEECVQACLTYKKNVNANVNGVTVRQVLILYITLILYRKLFYYSAMLKDL